MKRKVKQILIFLVLLVLASCAFKNEDNGAVNNTEATVLQAQEVANSTGDGIPDAVKNSLGLNPNIAYFPRLSVFLVKDIAMGAIFKERTNLVETDEDYLMISQQYASTDSTKGGDLDLLKVLRKKILINQYNFLRNIRAEERDTITDEDLKSSILSSWTDEQYYQYRNTLGHFSNIQANVSGKFRTNFKLKIKESKGVSQISNVKLKSFYYDFKNLKSNDIYSHYLLRDSGAKETIDLSSINSEYVPATNYSLFANEIKNTDIQQKINGRNEIGIEFEDFDYQIAGRGLNYSKVISSIIDKCAKIVISDGKTTEIYYVSPVYTLSGALKAVGKDFTPNKDGSIDSLGNVQTNISQPVDFDSLKNSDLEKGVWSIFGESDNLNDQIKAKGFYFISYASMKDLLDASSRELKITDSKNDDHIYVERIVLGDELTINIQSLIYKRMDESHSNTLVPGACVGGGCNFAPDPEPFLDPGMHSTCRCTPDCNLTNSTPVVVPSSVDLEKIRLSDTIKINDEYGNQVKADIFSYENNVVIKFKYPMAQLKNKLSIYFENPDDKEYSVRSGIVATTCKGGGASYSNVTWKNKYEFKYGASIIGALKY